MTMEKPQAVETAWKTLEIALSNARTMERINEVMVEGRSRLLQLGVPLADIDARIHKIQQLLNGVSN